MMERMKTAVLTVLVFASLVQSYMLVFNTPKYEQIQQGQYVQSDLTGTQVAVEDLLFPQ